MIFIRQKLHQHSGTNFEFCIKAGVTRKKNRKFSIQRMQKYIFNQK